MAAETRGAPDTRAASAAACASGGASAKTCDASAAVMAAMTSGYGAAAWTPRDLRDALRRVLAGLHVGNSNPFSLVAAEAAYRHGREWLDELMVYLQITQKAVAEHLQQHLPAVKVTPAEGTYLLWLDCRGLGLSDVELQRFLVDDAGLGLSAGTVFGQGGSGFMRLNIGAPRAEILAAIRSLVRAWRMR